MSFRSFRDWGLDEEEGLNTNPPDEARGADVYATKWEGRTGELERTGVAYLSCRACSTHSSRLLQQEDLLFIRPRRPRTMAGKEPGLGRNRGWGVPSQIVSQRPTEGEKGERYFFSSRHLVDDQSGHFMVPLGCRF